MKKIAVLMATYNGEKYLQEQVNSILNQNCMYDVDLYIQDDNSTDNTWRILEEYEGRPGIFISRNKNKVNGPVSNFSSLFNSIRDKNYDYVMFSDQDDIWYENKIEKSIEKIANYDNEPKLLYTNFLFWNMENNETRVAYNEEINARFETLFVQNWLMGCTMVLNKKMVEYIDEIPLFVENHDFWISLVASTLDKGIVYYSDVTMKHRLHNSNVTARAGVGTIKNKIIELKLQLSKQFRKTKYGQWESEKRVLRDKYNAIKYSNEIKEIMEKNSFKRSINAFKFGFKGINLKKTIIFYIQLILYKNI